MKTTLTLLSQAKCLTGLDGFLFIICLISFMFFTGPEKSCFKIIKSFKYHFTSDLITVQQGQVNRVLENVKRIDNNKQCQSCEGIWTGFEVRYFCLINFK